MSTVTFEADEDLVKRAEAVAKAQGKDLDDLLRAYLVDLAEANSRQSEALGTFLQAIERARAFGYDSRKGFMTREEANGVDYR